MANKFKPSRVRKHKARVRAPNDCSTRIGATDPNASVIDPNDQKENALRKQQLREILRAQQPQTSSKKKKRLNKYIETKLRKEETLDLLKKLGSNVIDTSQFKSSRNLGLSDKSRRHDRGADRNSVDTSTSSSSDDEGSQTLPRAEAASISVINKVGLDFPATTTLPNDKIGIGLKRPLEIDDEGLPIIRKKQRVRGSPQPNIPDDGDESSWDGFGSDSLSQASSEENDNSEDHREASGEDSEIQSETGEERALLLPLSAAKAQHIPMRPAFRARSDFKDWAQQQINKARDFAPSVPLDETPKVPENNPPLAWRPRPPEYDALPKELQVPGRQMRREAYSVKVERSPNVQAARLQLPIVAEEQKIIEAVHNNPAVVVTGSTGSGKTTQVPQFLYEAGYGSHDGPTPGMIGVTQPRRVAAVAMAQRVGQELSKAPACAYQIRFDSTVGRSTAIKFMTDGILIREIAQDFALTKYSAIIIDEAHERSVNTDILIGLMSRIVDLRAEMSTENQDVKPLKLIIMSATLMTNAFIKNSNLFRGIAPPLVESEGRQHPVTIHFARRTQRNYVDEAFRKVTRAHRKLPKGGILVFMTAQNEISALMKKLQGSLHAEGPSIGAQRLRLAAKEVPLEAGEVDLGDDRLAVDESLDEFPELDEEEDCEEFDIQEPQEKTLGARILPLYSQLPTKEQLRVFEEPPEGTRSIVLATNVAETSITIPGVRYVFDCGRAKERKYDKTTGVQTFQVDWISKASAAQRSGRAGRTGPGHCYRLYSSAVYERDFPEHTEPEILRMPVEGLVLQLKSMDLQHVVNFPFPTAPSRTSIRQAEKLLSYLGAIDIEGRITPLGRDLSTYPVSPRFAKILAIGHQQNCMYLSVAMVAALATPELFVPENLTDQADTADKDDEMYTQAQSLQDAEKEMQRKEYNRAQHFFSNQDKHADVLKLLSAFCAYAWAREFEDGDAFCARMFLRPKAMKETFQLYRQLLGLVALNRPGSVEPQQPTIAAPTAVQKVALKQITAAAFLDQIAIRADLAPSPPGMSRKPKRAVDVPYLTLFPSHEGTAETLDQLAVYTHPSSVLARASAKDLPAYLIYSSLQRAAPKTADVDELPKTRMHPLTAVGAAQLAALARGTPLLQYGKPLGRVESVEGERNKRMAWVVPTMTGGESGRSWPLPAVKVLQRRDKRGDWVVEGVEK